MTDPFYFLSESGEPNLLQEKALPLELDHYGILFPSRLFERGSMNINSDNLLIFVLGLYLGQFLNPEFISRVLGHSRMDSMLNAAQTILASMKQKKSSRVSPKHNTKRHGSNK